MAKGPGSPAFFEALARGREPQALRSPPLILFKGMITTDDSLSIRVFL